MTTFWVLVLIYTPFQISVDQFSTKEECELHTHGRVGNIMEGIAWDSMGWSNPIPKVAAAFCAPGESQ